MGGSNPAFGGEWTEIKLNILGKYLDAYTTALKNKSFRLLYIDAFAGAGQIDRNSDDGAQDFIDGSASRAIAIEDKPFDELIFVEKDPKSCAKLKSLSEKYPERNVVIKNLEANEFLCNLDKRWQSWRGVLFLDPFATAVERQTLRTVAGFKALDTWILFPVSAVSRILPTSKKPDDVDAGWAKRLDKIYGGDSWRELYRQSPQLEIFPGDSQRDSYYRESGVGGLISIYQDRLREVFDRGRFLPESRALRNSKRAELFRFLFCVGNPGAKAIKAAKPIASHILKHM